MGNYAVLYSRKREKQLLDREARSSKLLGKNFNLHWCSFLLKVQHEVAYSASFLVSFFTRLIQISFLG